MIKNIETNKIINEEMKELLKKLLDKGESDLLERVVVSRGRLEI